MTLDPQLPSLGGVALARTPAELRAWTARTRRAGRSIAVVPTMGALHRGHMALVADARQRADTVVVTIFVNPLQFGPREDFSAYPRPLEADCALCQANGVDVVFAPGHHGMYPEGFQTHVEVGRLAEAWCGASRPGHFRGVATVVCKLLNLAMADVAVFGEKDWQQLQVIARMARDLDHPTEIVGAATVRESDGLALSSRNAYLSADERQRAPVIHAAMVDARRKVAAGTVDATGLVAAIERQIRDADGRLDYVAIVDPSSLEPLAQVDRPARALVAAFFGRTRLIDNLALWP